MKLDRLLAKHRSLGRTQAHRALAARRVKVNGCLCMNGQVEVDRFTLVELDGEVIQQPARAVYLMLHKPAGILSATRDPGFTTVIDLIDDPDRHTLHIAGRLDRSTTGLVLLTNDGRWSKRLMEPAEKVPKVYLVETADDIPASAIAAFAAGFYFHTEDITTEPAHLEILAPRCARLTLYEGRYHQVKRMFHRVQNRVISLHRHSIGPIVLPPDLSVGQWRHLSAMEVAAFA